MARNPFARLKVSDSSEIELTLEITMNKAQWMELRAAILDSRIDRSRYIPDAFCNSLDQVIGAAEKHFDAAFKPVQL